MVKEIVRTSRNPRRRLRFWMLVSVSLLACVYVASWPLTELAGKIDIVDSKPYTGGLTVLAPLLIREDMLYTRRPVDRKLPTTRWHEQRHYLWLFGKVVMLSETKQQVLASSGS